jgi:G3E family GTPase
MAERSRIPVTLLTGFLGSGKTTLVSRLLRDPRFSDTAVIINEFGEVGLDHLLVEHLADDAVIEMTSGCLCCTVRGDVRRTLLMLQHRSETGEIPLFERVVIETTGLADPAPVIHTLMTDPRLDARFRLARVATVVDAVNGLATLDEHPEAVKQAAVADTLLISKTDTAEGKARLGKLVARLLDLAPGAVLNDVNAPGFDLRALVDDGGVFDGTAKPAQVVEWLNAEAHAQVHVGHDRHSHEHHHHAHDVNRHSDAIRAFCLTLDRPMSRLGFSFAMELLASHQGPDLLRVKGLVAIDEYPDKPVVIHMVQHMLQAPARLDAWPSDDRRTRLVFITRGIPPEPLAGFFKRWTSADPATLASVE